tara:strand:- start:200 stop:727 length:528 start_codon:yes stop_codon:yes gene_type:complete
MSPFDAAWGLLKAERDALMRIGDGSFEPRQMPPALPVGGIRGLKNVQSFEAQMSGEPDYDYYPANARVAHPAIQGLMSRRGMPVYSRRSQVVAPPDPNSGVEMERYLKPDTVFDPDVGAQVAVHGYRDPTIAHSQFHPEGLAQRQMRQEERGQMREQKRLFGIDPSFTRYPEFTP